MAGKKKQVEEVNDSIEFGTNEFFNELIINCKSFADIDDINDSFSLMEAELFVTVQLVRLFVIEKTNGCTTKYIVFGSLEGNKSNCP